MDINIYKSELKNMSEEDRKKRIKNQWELVTGKQLGPLTGYSSIDLQWLKHYSEETIDKMINFEVKDESMYETLYKYASKHLEDVAFEYLGVKCTYKQLLYNIDRMANALGASNIKENDIVIIDLPNMPEARYLIYACSKIGAIANPIMPTTSELDFEAILKNTNSKHLFLMEGLTEKYSKLLEEHNIPRENVVEISPIRTSAGILKIAGRIKSKGKISEYDKYLQKGTGTTATLVERKSEDIALIEQTGGTTAYTTKGVSITNGNVYASNFQLSNGEFNFQAGDSLLDILLPSISYGASFEHLTLTNGIKNYMIPTLVKKDILKKISKFKPNHIMMGPLHLEFITADKKSRNWSFLKNAVTGGDTMLIGLERAANEKLKRNKANVEVEQGYGMSECFGAAVCNHNGFIKEGSLGIPHILTTIGIFKYNEEKDDYTTDEEVRTGNEGEICVSSPIVMKEYLNNSEETSLVLKQHRDGKIWLHTGDIGYIDKDGYLYITDRIKDLIFRNGFKVSPKKVNKILQDKIGYMIEDGIVIGVPDDIERNVPVFFYKLKKEYEEYESKLEEELQSIYQSGILSEVEIPKASVMLEEIPRTGARKINKKEIKKNYLENIKNQKQLRRIM